MTEFRIFLVIAALFAALLGYVVLRAELNDNARGCRASGGTWHLPQQSCTWDTR